MAEENITRQATWGREEEENTLQLADIWGMIWNNRIWYVLSIILCLFLAVFYLYHTPKTYNRSAKVIVDEAAENSSLRELASFGAATAGRSSRLGGTNVYNEIQAFTSPDLMSRVVERLGYESQYVEQQFLRTRELFTATPVTLVLGGDNPPSSFSFTAARHRDSTVVLSDFTVAGNKVKGGKVSGALRDTLETPVGKIVLLPTERFDNWGKDITVSWTSAMNMAKSIDRRLSVALSDKQSSVVVIGLEDRFPARAANIISTLIDIYNEDWVDNKNRAARNTSEFINERLGVIEQELGGVESDLRTYKETHGISDIQNQAQAYLTESSTYSAKYFEVTNALSIARYVKEYLMDPTHANSLIPAGTGIDPAVEAQIQEYNTQKLNRDRLLSASSNENPVVADMNEALQALRSSINRSIDNLISTLQLQANKIQGQESEIRGRISNVSGQELQLLSIERQQKVKEELYIYLLQKREENEIASLVNVGNTRLIMNPNGSSAPVAPNTKMILLIALILGLGLPFAVFFLMNQLDTRVKNRGDLTRIQAPFLAEIPQMGVKGNWWQRLRTDRFNSHNSKIIVKPGKRDMMNEAYRVLRTNLDLMASSQEGCHKIMVTSFNPNAGKTFTIMNMAATMALKNSKVLLLDLDLRKGTLSKALETEKDGVAEYLNGRIGFDEMIHNVREHLDLIPVGNLPPNPSELLLTQKFTDMIGQLATRYDYIFVDCPPVDIVADTSIIGKHADITVFLMRANLFDKRAIPAVEELYESGRFNRMAIILNGVEGGGSGYGRSYGYGYGHGYGYGYGQGYGYGYGNQNDDEEDDDKEEKA